MGLPIYSINYMSSACIFVECTYLNPNRTLSGDLFIQWVILISGIGVLLMAIPIWRSAGNYTGRHVLAVWAARVYVFLTLTSALPLMAVIYSLAYYAVTGHW